MISIQNDCESVSIEEKMLSLLHKHQNAAEFCVSIYRTKQLTKLQEGIKCTIIFLIAVCVKCKM